MPKIKRIKKVLLLGAGPTLIGQGSELEVAALQAREALKEEGCQVVVVNDNPAALVGNPGETDQLYLEPLNSDVLEQIIAKEKPDLLMAAYGGINACSLVLELSKKGGWGKAIKNDIGIGVIAQTQNREFFRKLLTGLNMDLPTGGIAQTLQEGMELGVGIGFPLIIRPSFSNAGLGSMIVYNREELELGIQHGLNLSPIGQVAIEQFLEGWEEVNLQLLRDGTGVICPVAVIHKAEASGIHAGNSLCWGLTGTVEAAVPLVKMIKPILDGLKAVGSFQVRLLQHPETGELQLLDINPRFTPLTLLASELSGCPVAKLAAKLALGYTLAELGWSPKSKINTASSETVGRTAGVGLTLPCFDFKRFVPKNEVLGPAVQAVGTVMTIGSNMAEALQKACRALETDELEQETATVSPIEENLEKLSEELITPRANRLFRLSKALKQGMSLDDLQHVTKVASSFLNELVALNSFEEELTANTLKNVSAEKMLEAKQWGYSDRQLAKLWRSTEAEVCRVRKGFNILPQWLPLVEGGVSGGLTYDWGETVEELSQPGILMIGSGANRILQGSEGDWALIQMARAFKTAGYRVVLLDPDGANPGVAAGAFERIYREPVELEAILAVMELEQIDQVMLAFGGARAQDLASELVAAGVELLDRSFKDGVDHQNSKKYQSLTKRLGLSNWSADQGELGDAIGVTVNGVGDGNEFIIAGITEQIETPDINPGDSAMVLPPYSLSEDLVLSIKESGQKLAKALGARGWLSLRFAVKHDQPYILEILPWESLDMAFLSKAMGINWAKVAARVLIGQSIAEQKIKLTQLQYTAVKEAVFSDTRFLGSDPVLDGEKRSSGMVLGLDVDFAKAFIKAQLAAGEQLPVSGKVYLSIRNADKRAFMGIAEHLLGLGFTLLASEETATVLKRNQISCTTVHGVGEGRPNILDLMKNGEVQWIFNTPSQAQAKQGEIIIRSNAVLRRIPLITSLSKAWVMVTGLKHQLGTGIKVSSLQDYLK